MENKEILVKKIDKLGRLTLPAKWRKNLGDLVIMMKQGNEICIMGLKDFKLTDLFDSIEFSGDKEDWEDVKKLERRLLDDILGF